jgi:nicotinate phosphoribosyltransferase
VRIDSGNLGELAFEARADPGRGPTVGGRRSCVSGDLDEWKVADLVRSGAPIDAFGVGTELITSRDAPALSMVYKLVAMGGKGG